VGENKAQGIPSTARRTRVLVQDPNHLDIVFAGTTEGLYRTFDGGKHWMQTTSSDVIVNDVYVDPENSKHVLMATDRRGVLVSDDGGDSFVPSNSGFTARQITAFAGDARHPAIVYVGVVNDKDSGGVFVSRSGGLSWSHLSDGLDGHDVFSMGQAPDGTILAGTEHGIYRLKDSLWERVGDEDGVVAPVAPDAPAPAAKSKGARRARRKQRQVAKTRAAAAVPTVKNFDGSVYDLAVSGETLFAATSQGVLRSTTGGTTWNEASSLPVEEWRFVAASQAAVVVASLNAVRISMDGGNTWKAVSLPPKMTQVTALSVDDEGQVWLGDRDGVYISGDKGSTWEAPANMGVRSVNSIFYDQASERMLVTARDPATVAYAIDIKSKQTNSWETGWDLRFLRPVGDHLVAATFFDGIVVQPRMVDSALVAKH
jgi:ligand-binding sensor domain-containing protein